jgi:transcriptional regulator with XRE-family HTH domain
LPQTYRKLRGRIVEKYGTLSNFAKALDLSTTQLSKTINGGTDFSVSRIEKWAKLLDIPPDEYYLYFFVKRLNIV